jgi:hypothetical protein
VGSARRQQALGPDDTARVEDGPRRLPDHPLLLSGSVRPTPPGQSRYSRSESPFGVAAAVMPRKTT